MSKRRRGVFDRAFQNAFRRRARRAASHCESATVIPMSEKVLFGLLLAAIAVMLFVTGFVLVTT